VRSIQGISRDFFRLNFDVYTNISTFTNYYLLQISGLQYWNFKDFFAGKAKKFEVVGTKMAIL
jgi:hypothetical protein